VRGLLSGVDGSGEEGRVRVERFKLSAQRHVSASKGRETDTMGGSGREGDTDRSAHCGPYGVK
jgi:hypothetical protein